MTSSINPANVDGTFPVAGQDNDSQGFRDNFTNIANNFTNAKTEIEDIQTNAILKSALSGTVLDNDGAGTLLKDFEVRDFSKTRIAKGSTSGTVTFNYTEGSYQTVTSSGSLTFAFSNFSASGKHSEISIEVAISSIAHTVTLPASVSIGTAAIKGLASSVITFDETGTFIFTFGTHDAGTTVSITDDTRGTVHTVTDAITAGATQTQAGATALTSTINRVTVSGTAGDGVKLPAATPGAEIIIINADATETIQVWPNTSDTINGGVADAVDATALTAGSTRRYVAVDTTDWYAV